MIAFVPVTKASAGVVAGRLLARARCQVVALAAVGAVLSAPLAGIARPLLTGPAPARGLGVDGCHLGALVFEHLPGAVALVDGGGVVRAANPALARWCQSTAGALVGRVLGELVEPDDAGALAAAVHLEPGAPGRAPREVEVRLVVAGASRWVRVRVAHVPHAPSGVGAAGLRVVQVDDVDHARATTARLSYEANHDALTGLPNRRALIAALGALVADPGGGGAVVMLDVDAFKAVNDRLGHDSGDELLGVVADRLRAALGSGQVAGRLGGDEMLVLAAGIADQGGALALGQRVLAAVAGPVVLRAGSVALGLSVGVCHVGPASSAVGAVLAGADAALYRAKANGGGCVRQAPPGRARPVAGLVATAAPVATRW